MNTGNLKTLKSVLNVDKMLNGRVVIDTFSNITQNDYSDKSQKGIDSLKLKEEQLRVDLEKTFKIGADFSG